MNFSNFSLASIFIIKLESVQQDVHAASQRSWMLSHMCQKLQHWPAYTTHANSSCILYTK